MRKDLITGILVACLGIAMVLSVPVSGFAQNATSEANLDESERAAVQGLEGIAASAALVLNIYMNDAITEMLLCAGVCAREGVSAGAEQRARAGEMIGDWRKLSGAFKAILLLDKAGLCVASAPSGFANRDFSGDKDFQRAIAGNLAVSDVHKSEIVASLDPRSPPWTLGIAVPVKIGNEVQGVLIGYVYWPRVERLLSSIHVGKTGYAFVLNPRNQIIVHPGRHLYGEDIAGPKINLPGLAAAAKKKARYATYEYQNIKTNRTDSKLIGLAYPGASGNFPGLGWAVGAGADRSELLPAPSWKKLFLW